MVHGSPKRLKGRSDKGKSKHVFNGDVVESLSVGSLAAKKKPAPTGLR